MSDAGKELLLAFENELENARALGITADWWTNGNDRKGVSVADQQAPGKRPQLHKKSSSTLCIIGYNLSCIHSHAI